MEGCKYTFACPRRLVVMSDLFPDGEEGDKTRTEPSEKEATELWREMEKVACTLTG